MKARIKPCSWLLCAGTLCTLQAVAAEPDTWREPVTGLEFVRIAQHCFKMGTAEKIAVSGNQRWGEYGYAPDLAAAEKPRHEVCLDSYWIGRTEISATVWQQVMGSPPPQGEGDLPATGITWPAANDFARRLSSLLSGKTVFRLPTEAEWEAACRAGSPPEKPLFHIDALNDAWERAPWTFTRLSVVTQSGHVNALGIQGMLGNVWEWVADGYSADAYRQHVLYNPVIRDEKGGTRGLRGGSHRSEAASWRCAARSHYPPAASLPTIGLRLVRQEAR